MSPRTMAPAVAVLATVAALAGCSSSPPSSPAASVDAVAAGMSEATAAGADPSQIALFADGTITYSDYESAMNGYASCARDAGYTVSMKGTRVSQGVTLLNVTLVVPTGKGPDLADACYDTFAKFVDMYWQAESPDAIAFNDRRAKALAPQLHDCLAGYKVDVPDDASFDELITSAVEHMHDVESESCMSDIGYMTWQG